METPSDSAAVAPLKELNQSPPPPIVSSKTPPLDLENQSKTQSPQISTCETNDTTNYKCKSSGTPDRLKVPKSFKYPERYTSPTDHMISPISKGLLARSRRGALLPPSLIHSKINELRAPEAGQVQLHQ